MIDKSACPSPEQLTRPEYSAHVRECPLCKTELEMIESFAQGMPRGEEREAVAWIVDKLQGPAIQAAPARRARWGWLENWQKPALALAGLLVVSGIALQWRPWQRPGVGRLDSVESGVVRSLTIGGLQPAGDLGAAPAEFRWDAVKDAARYEFAVVEVDGAAVWRGSSPENRLRTPPPLRALFLPRKTLLWSVTAFDAQGGKLAAAEPTRLRLNPR